MLIRKTKTHTLFNKIVTQRLVKGPRFLKPMYRRKWLNIITIDDAWSYIIHVSGKRKVAYKLCGKLNPDQWRKHWKQKKPQGVMFVARITSRGPTAVRFGPSKSKVNAGFHINKILKPLFEIDILKLFGKDAKNVVLHNHSAPAHKTAKTVEWLQERNIKHILADLQNSPDQPDGFLKLACGDKGLKGLKRMMNQEWKKITVNLC